MIEEKTATTSAQHPMEGKEGGRQSLASISDTQRRLPKKDRRLLTIQRTGLVLSVLTALTGVGYILIFFQTRAWQVLGPAGLLAVASGLFLVAHNLARKGHPDLAAYLMMGMMLMLPSFALFLTGATQVLAFGTLVLSIALASLVLMRRQMVWAVFASLAGAGLAFLIDWRAPWPRFDIAQLSLFMAFVFGTISVAVLAIVWQLVRAYRYIDTIRTRLSVAFVLVALVPVVTISLGAGIAGLQSDRQQAFERLETVAALKEVEIKNWLRDLQTALANTLSTEDTLRYMPWLTDVSLDALRQEAQLKTRDHFQSLISQEGWFEELFLMDVQGQVVVSTDSSQEGKSYSHQAYFQEGLKGVYVQPPSYSPSLGQTPVIFTRPVIDREGHIFVLAGRASTGTLNEIMLRRAGLGETVETYLVDGNYALLTRTGFGQEGMTVSTRGVVTAAESQDKGTVTYEGYQGRPVLGAYHWLPELQVALLVEQDRSEAFRSTYVTLGIIGGVALAAALAAVTVSLFVTRSIANPLANLTETAIQIATGDLARAAEVERGDEIGVLGRAFNSMTSQLRDLIGSLEQRVAERTRDLKRRALQLQAAAEVGRAAASLRDLDELLSQVTHLISERFGFYHAGVFLLDEAGEYAVLQAANSEGGQRMLARGHRLPVGQQGIVGYVTGRGEPRIALDVGADAVFFDNPDMPYTRSEMALPLVAGGRVLGALDVQSVEEAAFTPEDIEVLQVLADQVAVAIENARLFAETQEALEATRRAYGEMSRQAWEETLHSRTELGFRSDERGVTSAGDLWRPEMEQALHEGRTVQISDLQSLNQPTGQIQPLAVPIKVRGQVIGVLDTYKPDDAGRWMPEEIAALEEITEQLGAALESARLYEDVQRTAARERLTREITDELHRATTTEGIVQTAVDALFRVLGTSRAFGQLEATPPTQDRGTDGP
jgi:GAF domain-containing protein/HAMP domain-containing protein